MNDPIAKGRKPHHPRLFVAPSGAGKTAYAVRRAGRHAAAPLTPAHVLVASALQAGAFRRRLADSGGALGVHVLTFEELYRTCLRGADLSLTEISEGVQLRVIRSVLREIGLKHYAAVSRLPGFARALKSVIDELKAGRVHPDDFSDAVVAHGFEPRLHDLASVYAAYQSRLQRESWSDPAGLGWLALAALKRDNIRASVEMSLLIVDGFDDFTPVQLDVLAALADTVGELVITLTGDLSGPPRALAHRRFARTCRELMGRLNVEPEPLPRMETSKAEPLAQLEAGLFQAGPHKASSPHASDAVTLIEAPSQATEVRAALRWAKRAIVQDAIEPDDVVLLARDLDAYRPYVVQVAAEFGIPVHIYAGRPLAQNPAVAALMDLLRLTLPLRATAGAAVEAGPAARARYADEPSLPPRLVIEAWRSPYFDWSSHAAPAGLSAPEAEGARHAAAPTSPTDRDVDVLAGVARRGRVIAGLSQWEEAFEALVDAGTAGTTSRDMDALSADSALSPPRVAALRERFDRFVLHLRPPGGSRSARHFVRWMESLIGPDPNAHPRAAGTAEPDISLGVIRRVCAAMWPATWPGPGENDHADDTLLPSSNAERDLAALRAFKRLLRGLVWAEEALNEPPSAFPAFFEDLVTALESATYRVPRRADGGDILVADLVAARGVPFRAAAVLGLAEGAFPAPQSEDPLVWDADRKTLGLPLRPSTDSAEAEYFYEAVAAPSDRLLLTRPRLTDDGAPWKASPFWEEVRRLTNVEPLASSNTLAPPPEEAASWPELMQGAARRAPSDPLWRWIQEQRPAAAAAVVVGAQVVTMRQCRADSPFDGGLHALSAHFSRELDSRHVWSASRLEAYLACPFLFFVGSILALEPWEEPRQGIDWVHRGNIYHKILERVYQAVDDPTELTQLLEALPDTADEVLDRAPEEQGFRRTAWWAQTRRELVEDVRRSLEALHDDDLRGGFVPGWYEAAFGLGPRPPLVVRSSVDGDRFQLRGLIDRVDRDPEGKLRIIDYKTAGPSSYRDSALQAGEKIQLPLYALAAREALDLGDPVSGFYWHVRHAEPSPFTLESFGLEEAVRTAVAHAWDAIRGARGGSFLPHPPKGGCPPYCPAVGFCWHYERRYGG